MARRKQPAQRTAERAVAEALYAIKAHRKHCAQCRRAQLADRPAASCDLGWHYAKLERRAAAQLRDVMSRPDRQNARQLALW